MIEVLQTTTQTKSNILHPENKYSYYVSVNRVQSKSEVQEGKKHVTFIFLLYLLR